MLINTHPPEFLVLKEPDSGTYQPNPPKLLDRVRAVLRRQHYALRTEQAYVHWIIRFIKIPLQAPPSRYDLHPRPQSPGLVWLAHQGVDNLLVTVKCSLTSVHLRPIKVKIMPLSSIRHKMTSRQPSRR